MLLDTDFDGPAVILAEDLISGLGDDAQWIPTSRPISFLPDRSIGKFPRRRLRHHGTSRGLRAGKFAPIAPLQDAHSGVNDISEG